MTAVAIARLRLGVADYNSRVGNRSNRVGFCNASQMRSVSLHSACTHPSSTPSPQQPIGTVVPRQPVCRPSRDCRTRNASERKRTREPSSASNCGNDEQTPFHLSRVRPAACDSLPARQGYLPDDPTPLSEPDVRLVRPIQGPWDIFVSVGVEPSMADPGYRGCP